MSQLLDVTTRFWDEIVSRPSGPMAFRFILQPVMASLMAVRDGIKDAKTGRSPYLWTIIWKPEKRSARLREGIKAVSRVLMLGIAMDLIYQVIALHGIRPLELIVIVFALAFLPYLILRGPVARIAKHLLQRKAAGHETHLAPHG